MPLAASSARGSSASRAGGRVGTEDSTAFTRKGIVGDWMAVFTERDRRLFEEEAGELLTELGYSSA